VLQAVSKAGDFGGEAPLRSADYGALQFVLIMLTLLIEPASAEPLYFSCNGIHGWNWGWAYPPNSAPETISVILDLDKERFGWTHDSRAISRSCYEPTTAEEEALWIDPKTGKARFPKKGPFQSSTHCSRASATDLLYNFSISDDFATWECHEEGPEGCTERDRVGTVTRGTIDRLTGELSASRSHAHWEHSNDFKKEDSYDDKWHMKCVIKRRF
jgi:hypothetical protein